jgi:hypothetical protein
MALATRSDILHAQKLLWGAALAREAETRAPVALSCRTWRTSRVAAMGRLLGALLLLVAEALFPAQVALFAFAVAGLAFTANITLKARRFSRCMLIRPGCRRPPRAPARISRRIC